jgi:hypothetical protein
MGFTDEEIKKLDNDKCRSEGKKNTVNKIDLKVLNECHGMPYSFSEFIKNSEIGSCYRVRYCNVFQKVTSSQALCKTSTGDIVFLVYADKIRSNHTYRIIGKYIGEMTYETVGKYQSTVPEFSVVKSVFIY